MKDDTRNFYEKLLSRRNFDLGRKNLKDHHTKALVSSRESNERNECNIYKCVKRF